MKSQKTLKRLLAYVLTCLMVVSLVDPVALTTTVRADETYEEVVVEADGDEAAVEEDLDLPEEEETLQDTDAAEETDGEEPSDYAAD